MQMEILRTLEAARGRNKSSGPIDTDDRNNPYPGYSDSHFVTLALADFKAHMDRTGKICLRPWCWRLFYILFQPPYEPPWLSSWWSTSTREKKDLFLAQMEYLARHTDNFPAAFRFVQGLDQENWLFALNESRVGPVAK